MAKVSFNPDDMYQGGGLGIPEGWIEVTDAHAEVIQFNAAKGTGKQLPRMLAAVLTADLYTDESYTEKKSADNKQELVIEWGRDNMGAGPLEPLKLQPATATGPDDPTPVRQGEGLGTTGNTLDGDQAVDMRAPWGQFCNQLKAKGFKPQILGRGYFPDFVGLRCHVAHVKKANPKGGKDIDELVVDQPIKQFPYEKAAAAPATTTTKRTTKAAAATAVAGAPAATPTNGVASDDATAHAIAVLTAVAADHRGELLTVERLKTFATMKHLKDDQFRQKKQYNQTVGAQVTDPAFLAAHADIGYVPDYEPDAEERAKVQGAPATGGRFVMFWSADA